GPQVARADHHRPVRFEEEHAPNLSTPTDSPLRRPDASNPARCGMGFARAEKMSSIERPNDNNSARAGGGVAREEKMSSVEGVRRDVTPSWGTTSATASD
ncbi:hypothetical protein, partial [Nostocoides japonicum]|uniref:hypothetical protein n=1 Tax=Nostocoides japonicum TaxID=99481 RepID=UPI001F19B87E